MNIDAMGCVVVVVVVVLFNWVFGFFGEAPPPAGRAPESPSRSAVAGRRHGEIPRISLEGSKNHCWLQMRGGSARVMV